MLPSVESTFSQASFPPNTSSTSFNLGYFLLDICKANNTRFSKISQILFSYWLCYLSTIYSVVAYCVIENKMVATYTSSNFQSECEEVLKIILND